jgi:hypothetical protein
MFTLEIVFEQEGHLPALNIIKLLHLKNISAISEIWPEEEKIA